MDIRDLKAGDLTPFGIVAAKETGIIVVTVHFVDTTGKLISRMFDTKTDIAVIKGDTNEPKEPKIKGC